MKNGVYLDFSEAIGRLGRDVIEEKYGNLFDMYERITGENPYDVPMRIYPAPHYTMGGLWVDYNLQTTIPGLFAIGEANFSDHGANRLGASALMQGLADGYFVLPATIGNYLAPMLGKPKVDTTAPEFAAAERAIDEQNDRFLRNNGTKSVDHYHRELGRIVWDYCGMERTREGLEKALSEIPALRAEFEANVRVPGSANTLNSSLEKAGRVADFFELAELMCRDALVREESCGGHFRAEYQTEDGEALRNDDEFAHVTAWEWSGDSANPTEHREQLEYETSRWRRGATSEPHPSRLAAGRSDRAGSLRDLRGDRRLRGLLVPRDARRRQRGSHLGGPEPIEFMHDCREGICGTCGMMINGQAHGPQGLTTACQLHMRTFSDGDEIVVEPWRAAGFPVVKDLVVDRSAFDRIIEAGGYVSVETGSAQDANLIPIPKDSADLAMDAAACIGCGACVAACPNGAAQLFTSAKLMHLNSLPQGQPERYERTVAMVEVMEEHFGSCTNYGECEAACPKGISIDFIAAMNRDYRKALVRNRRSA
jgi:succinate dehydrogenase/fumarate reductase iron-sulfur protein